MATLPAKASDRVRASFHSFWLSDNGETLSTPVRNTNGLVVAQPDACLIATGVYSGPVNVSVELFSNAPPPAVDAWDEVIEVSIDAGDGMMIVLGPETGVAQGLPILTQAGPGFYRLRVHARGRDTAYDQAVDEPVEDYLLQVWPGPEGPEIAYKQTDRYGQAIRQAIGSD